NESAFADALDPDLHLSKTVDASTTQPGSTLHYTVTARNDGTGGATQVQLTDTFPDATTSTLALGALRVGGSAARPTSWLVPCATSDGTVVTNRAVVSGRDLLGDPEADPSDNTASVATTVRAPVVGLTASATPQQAGEASTVVLTYTNTGGAGVTGLTLTDTLSRDTYYSLALDQGTGPRPTTVTRLADGRTVLTWSLGALAAGGTGSVRFTTRTSLLLRPGAAVTGAVTLDAVFGTGCVLPTVTGATSSPVLSSVPTRDPLSQGYWGNHPATAELLARVQATYQRHDTSGDGSLSTAEQTAAFAGSGTAQTLQSQLLAVFLNLADRRVVASTRIASKTATQLALADVADAGRYGIATAAVPLTAATQDRYSATTTVLDEIDTGRSERY
ncbi:MAG: conserved repeat domain, partial [Frankiales bacterium]|nr:conserved repeat domain [Frankiales bacterium]